MVVNLVEDAPNRNDNLDETASNFTCNAELMSKKQKGKEKMALQEK